MLSAATLACILTMVAVPDENPLAKHVYPLSKPLPAPTFTIDVSASPESKAWAEMAKPLAEQWFGTICTLLATEGWQPPKTIKLTFRPKQDAPAWASGNEISISADWIKAHPDDLGMVVHELTHIVQSYPDNEIDAGWLVEGIADYVRWWRYEPEAPRPRIDPVKSSYKDAYRTTASFLAWTSRKYHMGLVPALDRELRRGKNPLPIFPKLTGKDVDTLWKEFVAA